MEIDVKKIARLSRLVIDSNEEERFQREMADIIGMVEKLPDIQDVSMTLDNKNPMDLRVDEIEDSLNRKEILKNAPQTEAGCFVVPKVID